MTALTPQQMRQEADRTESVAEGLDHLADRVVLRRSAAALRTAADQLEALNEFPHDCVCQWPHGDDHPEAYGNYCSCWKSVLTADTTPQESGYCHCGTALESHAIEEHAYVDMCVPPEGPLS